MVQPVLPSRHAGIDLRPKEVAARVELEQNGPLYSSREPRLAGHVDRLVVAHRHLERVFVRVGGLLPMLDPVQLERLGRALRGGGGERENEPAHRRPRNGWRRLPVPPMPRYTEPGEPPPAPLRLRAG